MCNIYSKFWYFRNEDDSWRPRSESKRLKVYNFLSYHFWTLKPIMNNNIVLNFYKMTLYELFRIFLKFVSSFLWDWLNKRTFFYKVNIIKKCIHYEYINNVILWKLNKYNYFVYSKPYESFIKFSIFIKNFFLLKD